MQWIRANTEPANHVFESVVRVVTLTGSRKPPKDVAQPFEWRSLRDHNNEGRFVPLSVEQAKTYDEGLSRSQMDNQMLALELEVKPSEVSVWLCVRGMRLR
jgi:hypothetical protein